VQHNREFYGFIRGGVPVDWRDAKRRDAARAGAGDRLPKRTANQQPLPRRARAEDQGVRTPNYNRRADLVCFVNGLPLVFIELKAVYKNIRAGFDGNLTDYMHEHSHRPRLPPQRLPGREQRRPRPLWLDHQQVGALRRVEAQRRGTRAAWMPRAARTACWRKDRLLDLVENFILFDDSKPGRPARSWRATIRCSASTAPSRRCCGRRS
jgi:type I restriction enzyme, R subunit